MQKSKAGHRVGPKHVAQRVPRGAPALILHKNAPEKHLDYAFKMGAKWGTEYPVQRLSHPQADYEQFCSFGPLWPVRGYLENLRNTFSDVKAKLIRIRKGGKSGGTQAYYPLT